jgi:hypothetical protein
MQLQTNNPIPPKALWGIAGGIVRSIAKESEAHEMGLLSQLLAGFGNAIGRGPHIQVGAIRHGTNLFVVNVGTSSKGRKGTAWGEVRRILKGAAPEWASERVQSGLSSGEGLIANLSDKSSDDIVIQSSDKRLFCIEPELVSVLKVAKREGNILSAILRSAWDCETLQTLTKNSPVKVEDPHISIVGHITKQELEANLSSVEISNGLGNRFLFFSVFRTKLLPEGGNLDAKDIELMTEEIKASIEFAKTAGRYEMSVAKELWSNIYSELSNGCDGIAGSLLARGEPQVLRLALIQAVLNRQSQIDEECLTSAKDIFDYCARSVREIYNDQTGNPLADRIKELLDLEPHGISKGQLLDKLGRNYSRGNLGSALTILKDSNFASCTELRTGGRPAEIWLSSKFSKTNELNEESPT